MVCLREVDTIKAHTLEVFIKKKKKKAENYTKISSHHS